MVEAGELGRMGLSLEIRYVHSLTAKAERQPILIPA
jgi:hypothetical protein